MSTTVGRIFNPYPGLRPFREEESHLFFGRTRQVDDLLFELSRSRFVAVMGPSGSGKSSLVAAGLFPALYGGFSRRVGSSWRIVSFRPGASPIRNLAEALSAPDMLGDDQSHPMLRLARIEATLRRSALGLADIARSEEKLGDSRLLVVVDQFEELFRFTRSGLGGASDGPAFVQLLIEATRSDAPIELIITMRSDFLGDCAQFRDLPETINQGLYLVPRLTRSQLREAITAPAAVGGAALAPRLVQRILNDTGTDPDALPLVQHALMRSWDLWEQRGPTDVLIDLDVYEAAGTVDEALSRHADQAFAELDDPRLRRIAEVMFKRLTEIGPDGRELRRATPIHEIQAVADASRAEVEYVIEAFGRSGRSFVTVSADDVVDISHESLIRQWHRLRSWAAEEARSREEYDRLVDAAKRWKQGEAALLRNPGLEIASSWWEANEPNPAWADRYDPAFDVAAEYLRRSRRASTTRRILEIAGVAALGVVAVLFAWLALRATRAETVAERQRDIAVARHLAGVSLDRGVDVREASILTAIEALRVTEEQGLRVPEAERALRAAMADPLGIPLPSLPDQPRPGGPVTALAHSPDGRWLATGSRDANVLLWDTNDPTSDPIPLSGQEDDITKVAFSPDGTRLAIGDESGTVLLWDIEASPPGATRLGMHASTITALAFSPDGRWLASAAAHPTARLWVLDELPTGSRPLLHDGFVNALAFNPDGSRLVTGSDGGAWVWDVESPEMEVTKLLEQPGDVVAVVYEPSDDWVALGSSDGSIEIISQDGETLHSLSHGDELSALVTSPDGRRLVSGGDDGIARVWDLADGDGPESSVSVLALRGGVGAISFSHDGRWLAIGGMDDAARLYEAPLFGSDPVVLAGPVRTLGFGLDGTLAVGGPDGSVRLYELNDLSTRPRTLHHADEDGNTTDVLSLAFSPDGSELATGTSGHATWRWLVSDNEADPNVIREERGERFEEAGITALAYTPDQGRLVTGSGDETVRIYDLDGSDPTPVPLDLGHQVNSLAVSPDGQWLAVAPFDDHAVLVDISSLQFDPLSLKYHSDDVTDVAFAADGSRLAVASQDTTVSIWDPDDPGRPTRKLEEHDDVVSSVAFSADGRWLATGSRDGTVRLWDAGDSSDSVARLDQGVQVEDVAFRPDGELLAVAGGGVVLLWDLDTDDLASREANPVVLSTGSRSAGRVVFSPDGRWLATTGGGGDAQLWIQLEDLVELACDSVGRNLTRAEWQFLMPGEEYRVTCEQWPAWPLVPPG